MDWFERHCACLEAPSSILHVGAGYGTELGVYANFQNSRVLLIEPQAALASELRRATASMPNVEVLQLAVSLEAGEASLNLFNRDELSSLQSPTGLNALFPGLAHTGAVSVDTLPLLDLVERLEVDESGENWLVVDALGAEPDIVSALQSVELEQHFSHIFLRAGAQPLFEGAGTISDILQQLAELGYEPYGVADNADTDFPRYHLKLNIAALEAATLRQKLALLEASPPIDEVKKEIKEEVRAQILANTPNPYGHNRTIGDLHRKELQDFAVNVLGLDELKPAYFDYLAARALQIERSCEGRLATTLQDAVARQLVLECVSDKTLCILEIGTLYGVGPAILYNHAAPRFDRVQVVGLDPFDGYYGKALDALLNQPVTDRNFIRNMRLADVPDEDFQIIKRYSTEPEAVAAVQELAVNLLVIDGDHTYGGVKWDFETYLPLVRPGGYIIIDDYNANEWPDVQRFVDEEAINEPSFDFLGAVSRTAVGRKLA